MSTAEALQPMYEPAVADEQAYEMGDHLVLGEN